MRKDPSREGHSEKGTISNVVRRLIILHFPSPETGKSLVVLA